MQIPTEFYRTNTNHLCRNTKNQQHGTNREGTAGARISELCFQQGCSLLEAPNVEHAKAAHTPSHWWYITRCTRQLWQHEAIPSVVQAQHPADPRSCSERK